jgi:hypothetical protein
MSFLNSLSFLGWGVLLSVPPLIVLLYFLKLKRAPLVVPSTYLWTRAIEDMHVNTIWQRLRKNILLWLQLLFVVLLILAVLRPGNEAMQMTQERLVLLIDQSASMNAKVGSETRLEIAKRRATELVDGLSPESVAMIIAFADEARVVQSYTNNRALLRRKLDQIQPTNRTTQLDEALQAASGLANPPQTYEEGNPNALGLAQPLEARLYLFTDGGVEVDPEFVLGNLQPEYIPIGNERLPNNVGIIAFSAAENPERPGEIQAFAQLLNSSDSRQTFDLELYLDDELLDARSDVELASGATGSLSFDVSRGVDDSIASGVLHLVMSISDDLPIDNSAYAVFNTRKQSRILVVTPGNDALELALETDELKQYARVRIENLAFLETETYRNLTETTAVDLVIYDRCAPEKMPMANTLFWGTMPPMETWKRGPLTSPLVLIDSDESHPLVEWLELGEVLVAEGFQVSGPPGTLNLVSSNLGSVVAIGQRLGFEDAVIGFELISETEDGKTLANTDWPRHPSFPMFIQNVINYLGNAAGLNAQKSYLPGQTVEIRTVIPYETISVREPKGQRQTLRRGRQNTYQYATADELGVYDVYEGEDEFVDQRFAVNLTSRAESDLRVPDSLELGYKEVQAGQARELGRREYWKWLLLLALVILGIEWYIYNRRIYV